MGCHFHLVLLCICNIVHIFKFEPAKTREPVSTLTLTCQNPYPWAGVRVSPGTGTGSPGIPEGYL